jgi:5-methyltetrahydropteroyltriglutamate--homocysteine methyltransferase
MTRIRTTHTGSLPRPRDLSELLIAKDREGAQSDLAEPVRTAVRDAVAQQAEAGIDVVSDGEMGKVSYATYVTERLSGFEGESEFVSRRRPEMEAHPDFAERWRALVGKVNPRFPACVGPVQVKDRAAVAVDIANLKDAAAAAGVSRDDRLFMTAASPGVIAHFFANKHYSSRETFLTALAEAMRFEYEAITSAGITLQIDCPDLAMSRHSVFADSSLEEFRREIALNVEALNHAVSAIPAERMRMHICWGNYDGPHDYDVPLRDIVDVILKAKPSGLVLESSNPRHGHEWRVWEDRRLPEGKYIVAGVVETTNNFVEHPEVVAQRLVNFGRVVGRDALMAGSDCGFGTVVADVSLVAPTIVWAKLRALHDGAALASRELER